ncbi:Abhydrolase domain-containing protein [Porphyridium purpureum]|uniref:Abhydrolase domain-containing protein n=1 Tax=Porphyridium purpureum TaxID=35688 RepID=A0A5J4YSG8_PORPP|nr:Abhydrolase domain-containing protein [Porphyridium purpureum]|eukprot:POR9090..scf236_6
MDLTRLAARKVVACRSLLTPAGTGAAALAARCIHAEAKIAAGWRAPSADLAGASALHAQHRHCCRAGRCAVHRRNVTTTAADGFKRGYGSAAGHDAHEETRCVVPLNCYKIPAKQPPSSGGAQAARAPTPMIMIHGLLASSGTYRSTLKRPEFASTRDVYALDMRNHGGSPQVAEMSYEAMVRDVEEFMDSEGIPRAIVMGHSMGGKVSSMLALEHPERVAGLVLVDIVPKLYDTTPLSKVTQAIALVDLEACKSRADVEASLEAHGVVDPSTRSFILTNLVSDGSRPGFYEWRVNIPVINDAIKTLMDFPKSVAEKQYTGPTLVIRGQTSDYVQDSDLPLLQKYFPRYRMHSVKNAAHWVANDNMEGFIDAVNGFLQGAEEAPASE